MSVKIRKELTEESIVKVVGGSTGTALNGNAESTTKWCEKCNKQTPHDENGECLICKLENTEARYRF